MIHYERANVLFFVILLLPIVINALFCSPVCGADTLVCSNSSALACNGACDPTYTYNLTAAVCQLPSTVTIFAQELSFDTNFAISGWVSNQPVANIHCGANYMLGPYVRNDYVIKNYTGLGTNHYSVDILYSFGLMGNNWANNSLTTIIIDGNGNKTIGSLQGQTCGSIQSMTPCSNNLGCFKNYHLTISHTTDLLSLQFTAVGSSIDTNVANQSWGVANLIILVHLCDPICQTCFSSTNTSCSSCPAGLFLLGSACILSCPYYTIPTSSVCVVTCPAYYFINTANKYCEPCPNGCPVCTQANTCSSWDLNQNPSNLFYDNIALWIILIVLGIVILGIIIWKCFLSKKSFSNILEEDVINQKTVIPQQNILEINNKSTQQMQTHWVEDINDMQMNNISVKQKQNDVILGIGNDLKNTI